MPRLIQVIESDDRRGRGVMGDPVRLVVQYHTTDGELLAERDPNPPEPEERKELANVMVLLRDMDNNETVHGAISQFPDLITRTRELMARYFQTR